MKTFLAFLLIGTIVLAISCAKTQSGNNTTCTNLDPSADSAALLKFAAANSFTPSKDLTGLYYQIVDSGTGAAPNLNSQIFVTYIGALMNGNIFDSASVAANTGFYLNNLIKGWQIGIPKIKVGGRIRLFVPSAFGYGCAGSAGGQVPGNAPLYFDVSLVNIK